jgi:hypothetical protein
MMVEKREMKKCSAFIGNKMKSTVCDLFLKQLLDTNHMMISPILSSEYMLYTVLYNSLGQQHIYGT